MRRLRRGEKDNTNVSIPYAILIFEYMIELIEQLMDFFRFIMQKRSAVHSRHKETMIHQIRRSVNYITTAMTMIITTI